MARAHFVTYIHDTEGRPIPGATVSIFDPDTTNEISQTIYENDTPDGTTKTNPFTADADGRLEFFLDTPIVFDAAISKAGYDSATIRGTAHQLTASTLTLEDGGSPLAQRPNIDFQDGFVLADDAANTQTTVDLDYAPAATLANVSKAAEAAGSSTTVARGDHKHDIDTATAGTSTPADTAAEGTATTLARSDHRHARADAYATTTQLANVDNAAEAAGTATQVARGDHKHGVNSAAPGASAPADTASAGTSASLALADHRHSREAFAAVAELADVNHAAESAGVSGTVSRGDHKHGLTAASTAELAPVAAAEAAGSSNSVPRGDHVHAHGAGYPGGHTDIALHHVSDTGAHDGLTRIYKTSDEVINNSAVLQADNVLAFPVLAGFFEFEFVIFFTSTVGADLAWDLSVPVGSTYSAIVHRLTVSAASTSDDVLQAVTDTGTSVGSTGTGVQALHIRGSVQAGGSGTVTFRWAQNSATATDTTVKAGSFVVAHEFA